MNGHAVLSHFVITLVALCNKLETDGRRTSKLSMSATVHTLWSLSVHGRKLCIAQSFTLGVKGLTPISCSNLTVFYWRRKHKLKDYNELSTTRSTTLTARRLLNLLNPEVMIRFHQDTGSFETNPPNRRQHTTII